MKTYTIYFTQTDYRMAQVEAESESAARQAWIDGDIDDTSHIEVVESAIVEIEEG